MGTESGVLQKNAFVLFFCFFLFFAVFGRGLVFFMFFGAFLFFHVGIRYKHILWYQGTIVF